MSKELRLTGMASGLQRGPSLRHAVKPMKPLREDVESHLRQGIQAINKESWRQQHCERLTLRFKEVNVERKAGLPFWEREKERLQFLEVKESAMMMQICCYLIVFILTCSVLAIAKLGSIWMFISMGVAALALFLIVSYVATKSWMVCSLLF